MLRRGIAGVAILTLITLVTSEGAAQSYLFWTHQHAGPNVERVGRDGSNPVVLFPYESLTQGNMGAWMSNVTADPLNAKIYITLQFPDSTGRIDRANFDGSDHETPIVSSSGPGDIVLDPENQHLYWMSALGIERANYDGSNRVTLVGSAYGENLGLAAYLRGGLLFWVGPTEKGICSANLDGSNPHTIVAEPGTYTWDIAVDPVGQRIYWCTLNGDIKSSWFDGTDVRTLYTGKGTVTALSIDTEERELFWSSGGLWRGGLDGNGGELVYTFGSSIGIGVDNSGIEPAVPVANSVTLGLTVMTFVLCGGISVQWRRRI